MQSMPEVIADPTQRARVVQSVTDLIGGEVANKGGLTGMAIKGGYKVVNSLQGGRMIPNVVDGLLDEFCGAIEPLHAQYRESGQTNGFDRFLQANSNAAVNALLSITDGRAERTSNGTLRKTYGKLRPMAEKNVAEALPGLGKLIDKHCA